MKKPVAKMPKPIPQPTVPVLDYHECITYLEEKYKFASRDYEHSMSHFSDWADAKGYTVNKKDPEGKHRNSSQIWYAEYRNDPAGEALRPPYCDFWHWLIDQFEVDNGCTETMYFQDWLEQYREEHEMAEGDSDYVTVICGYFIQEFGPEVEMVFEW